MDPIDLEAIIKKFVPTGSLQIEDPEEATHRRELAVQDARHRRAKEMILLIVSVALLTTAFGVCLYLVFRPPSAEIQGHALSALLLIVGVLVGGQGALKLVKQGE